MGSISATSFSSIQQSVLALQDSQDQISLAVLQKAQQADEQQGAAAVQLIEAASQIVDVRV